MTNTSEGGVGINMDNAKVELVDVALKGYNSDALLITQTESTSATTIVATRCEFANSNSGAAVQGSLTSATFNNCVFHDNKDDGIEGYQSSTIHLHGEATAIHSNGEDGISAYDSAKVIIHLPSHHNTLYNQNTSSFLAIKCNTRLQNSNGAKQSRFRIVSFDIE